MPPGAASCCPPSCCNSARAGLRQPKGRHAAVLPSDRSHCQAHAHFLMKPSSSSLSLPASWAPFTMELPLQGRARRAREGRVGHDQPRWFGALHVACVHVAGHALP